MTELITLAQIQQYKGITSNLDTAKSLMPYIIEAQTFDLRPFLGDEFYISLLDDFEASPSLSIYSDLYNGVNYIYANKTYKCDGLVPLIVLYAYSRYLSMSNIHSTRYGMVEKTNEFSQGISEAARARIIAQSKSQAVFYQENVKKYLDRNSTLYPLWNGSINRRQGSIKLMAIGGNSSNKDYLRKIIEDEHNKCDCDEI